MHKRTRTAWAVAIAAAAVSLMTTAAVIAKPVTYAMPDEQFEFKPAPGSDIAHNNCAACHSSDYVKTQPPAKGQAFWEGEVTKMIKVFKAPISDADAKVIADYLAKNY